MMKLEIIGFNLESCLAAQDGGAHRIELCDNPSEGGTTPSYGFIKAARKNLSIELYVMIRPRGGDFLYSAATFEIMKTDIGICKQLGCDGVVLGILNKDGTVDKKRTAALVEYAYPLGVTFHRAFDRTNDAFRSLEDVVETGCERILTSGRCMKATEGIQLLKDLVQQAGDRLTIMPGSGVNGENLMHIAETTGAAEFHSSAGMYKETGMEYKNSNMHETLRHIVAGGDEVKRMAEQLKSFENLSTNK